MDKSGKPTSLLGGFIGAMFFLVPALFVAGPDYWTVYKSAQSFGWDTVQATIVNIERVYDRTGEFEIKGNYEYVWADQRYVSSQFFFNPRPYEKVSPFNSEFGRYLQKIYRDTDRAYRRGQTIQAWVNPENRADAVIYRRVNGKSVLSRTVFFVIFGGLGIAILWSLVSERLAFLKINRN